MRCSETWLSGNRRMDRLAGTSSAAGKRSWSCRWNWTSSRRPAGSPSRSRLPGSSVSRTTTKWRNQLPLVGARSRVAIESWSRETKWERVRYVRLSRPIGSKTPPDQEYRSVTRASNESPVAICQNVDSNLRPESNRRRDYRKSSWRCRFLGSRWSRGSSTNPGSWLDKRRTVLTFRLAFRLAFVSGSLKRQTSSFG